MANTPDWERAWEEWRKEVVEAAKGLLVKVPEIWKLEEFENLKLLLESGPILIDWELFSQEMDKDESRERFGLTKEEWEKIKEVKNSE